MIDYRESFHRVCAEKEQLEREVAELREAATAVRNWIGELPAFDEYEIPDSIWLPFLAALEPHAQGTNE